MKILDATCGNRGIWFDKEFPNATYIDIRPEVKPQFVMDCTKTTFRNKEFDVVLFDPPHGNMGENSEMAKQYGHFTTHEIMSLVRGAGVEFNRILKDDGILILKWNTHDIKLERVLGILNGFKPLFGQKTSIRLKHISTTYWVFLIKYNGGLSNPEPAEPQEPPDLQDKILFEQSKEIVSWLKSQLPKEQKPEVKK